MSAANWGIFLGGRINFSCGPKWPVWDPLFDPKISPKKFMWVPFLRSFPGNEAHKLFAGGPEWGILGGGAKSLW